jgi:hypothetical protein
MINPNIQINVNSYSSEYLGAPNYPNITFDNFLDPDILKACSDEARLLSLNNSPEYTMMFNPVDDHVDQVLKRSISRFDSMPDTMRDVCEYMNNPEFVQFIRDLTGIEDLISDWELRGGGFHVTYPGGRLNIHHDFNYSDNMAPVRLYRKVNLLIYLNEHWEPTWGGKLELWDSGLTGPFNEVELKWNRAVIFNIEQAPHGHPHPLACPTGENRRSLAFYYYSPTPPNNDLYNRAQWLHNGQLV